MSDWITWHAAYDDPSSALSARLHTVQRHLSRAIDGAPHGAIRLLSLCAGQGHDVLGVLATHRRRGDVWATLVELDPRNAEHTRRRVADAGLLQVDIRQADASRVQSFADVLPTDVLLLCGIFGNVSDADIDRTVAATPTLCSSAGTVIWTRHRREPDYTDHIRQVFQSNGFDEIAFDALDTATLTGVGVNRLRVSRPGPPPQDALFTFRRGPAG